MLLTSSPEFTFNADAKFQIYRCGSESKTFLIHLGTVDVDIHKGPTTVTRSHVPLARMQYHPTIRGAEIKYHAIISKAKGTWKTRSFLSASLHLLFVVSYLSI